MNSRAQFVCWVLSIALLIAVLAMRSWTRKSPLPVCPKMAIMQLTANVSLEKPTDQVIQCNTVPLYATYFSGCENWMPNCEKTCVNQSNGTIPKHIHFISVGHPFTVVEWIAVLAAKKWIKPDRITVYTDGEQDSCWWRRVLPFVEHQLVNIQLVIGKLAMNGFVLTTLTQVTDFLRLSILYHYGGIYMDTDALTIRSFDDLLSSQVVLAQNCKGWIGNGLLLAQKHSCFMCEFARYSCTQFIGDTLSHSVHALTKYADMRHDGVSVLTRESGFFPNCGSRRSIYKIFHVDASLQPQLNFSDMYSLHLFNSSRPLHQTTIYNASWIQESPSTVALAIRRAIPNETLSEHYFDVQRCTNMSFVL